MFCSKCGTQNEDSAKYCIGCGCCLSDERKNMKKNNKVIYFIIAFIIISITVFFAVSIGIQRKKAKEYETYMESAEKYMEDLDYKEAKDFYLMAINVEPKKLDPYVSLAKIYMIEGEYGQADAILKEAVEQEATGDEKLIQELENVKTEVHTELQKSNYKEVLGQYQEALNNNLYIEGRFKFSDEHVNKGEYVNGHLLTRAMYYGNYGYSDSGEELYIYYSLIDLDGNGIDELLIGAGSDESDMWIYEMFTYDGEKEIPCFETGRFGAFDTGAEHSQITLHNDKSFSVSTYSAIGYGGIRRYILMEKSAKPVCIEQYVVEENKYYFEDAQKDRKMITEDEYEEALEHLKEDKMQIDWIKMKRENDENDSMLSDKIETSISHEDKIQYIRDIYYSTQENVDKYQKKEIEGLYTRFLDTDGKIRKIILYPSEMEFPEIDDPENYVAEYYYDLTDELSEILVFAFICNRETGEEYRYYVENGEVIRYIDEDGTTYDLINDAIGLDIYSDAYILYLQGQREIALAYGG